MTTKSTIEKFEGIALAMLAEFVERELEEPRGEMTERKLMSRFAQHVVRRSNAKRELPSPYTGYLVSKGPPDLSIREAAAALDLSYSRVYQFCQEGRLGYLADHGKYRIGQSELSRFAEEERAVGRPATSDS